MPVGEDSRVVACVNRPSAASRGSLLLIHGLSGSAEAVYMRRTARQGLARGWTVVRLNLRNCGRTEALATTMYNAGQWDDAGRVLDRMAKMGLPRPFAAIGFSLGGNLLLGYAGSAGASCRADALAGINPPLDLSACIRRLEAPSNALFQAYFSVALCAQLRRIRRVRAVPGPAAWPWSVWGVRAFDERFTAPDAGYANAGAYYDGASAGPVLCGASVPVLVLTSRNDPFVPADSVARWVHGPKTRLVEVPEGGHVGYWQSGSPRFWAAEAVLDWLGGLVGRVPQGLS